MRLIQVLCLVLMELSVGSLLFASLLPPRVIRSSFFTLNCLIAAIAAALALALTKYLLLAAWWDVRYLGITVIGATIAWGLFRLEIVVPGRLAMVLSGLCGLVLGVLPMVASALRIRGLETQAMGFFDAGVISAMLLLGATHVGMILGHWYLLTRRLSFEYLARFTQLLLGAVTFRSLVVISTVLMLSRYDAPLAERLILPLWSPSGSLFFFVFRIVLGLVLPFVLGLLVLRSVTERANQSATGLL